MKTCGDVIVARGESFTFDILVLSSISGKIVLNKPKGYRNENLNVPKAKSTVRMYPHRSAPRTEEHPDTTSMTRRS